LRNIYAPILLLSVISVHTTAFAQGKIKRASLSTAVSDPQTPHNGRHSVQQSIAHMGILTTLRHDNRTVTRGFLLPQSGVSKQASVADFGWVVYPNPFQTYINIDFNAAVSGDMVIRIHDVLGQLVTEKSVTAKKHQRLNLSHLSQAEYFLSVEVMGKTFSQTLLHHKPSRRNQ